MRLLVCSVTARHAACRDPRADEPARYAMCARGRAQYFILLLRMRVRARAV